MKRRLADFVEVTHKFTALTVDEEECKPPAKALGEGESITTPTRSQPVDSHVREEREGELRWVGVAPKAKREKSSVVHQTAPKPRQEHGGQLLGPKL